MGSFDTTILEPNQQNGFRHESTGRNEQDAQTDEEILQSLSQPPPVTSEKNVWAWWDGGLAQMRPWCQRNVVGWARLLGSDWTVRVLDKVPGSPSHWSNFLSPANLPDCFRDDTLSGSDHAGAMGSDMVRLPCLVEHGGVYMDVGIMLFVHLDDVCWKKIEHPASPYKVALPLTDASAASGTVGNFFIAARRGNGLLRRWMAIFREAWKGRTTVHGLSSHPLFAHLVGGGNLSQNLKGSPTATLDYFSHLLSWDRLRLLQDPTDGFNGPAYCRKHVFLLGYHECASAAMLTDNDGRKQFQMLRTRYDQRKEEEDNNSHHNNADSQAFRDARRFCEHMLTKTVMMKLYHFKDDDSTITTLAELWDRPENQDADHEPGTFAEYLRRRSICSNSFGAATIAEHQQQQQHTRKIVPVTFPPVAEEVLVAGLLEYDDE
jgi:hypothetical protein